MADALGRAADFFPLATICFSVVETLAEFGRLSGREKGVDKIGWQTGNGHKVNGVLDLGWLAVEEDRHQAVLTVG